MLHTKIKLNRLLATALSAVMLVGMIPVASATEGKTAESPQKASAEAVGAQTKDNNEAVGAVSWSYSDGTLTISGSGDMPEYDTKPWSSYTSSIKSLVIKSGVTSISEWAFSNMSALESVSLPNTLKSIGARAFFFDWKLKTLTIPNSVTAISTDAFFWCDNLRTVSIGSGLKTLDGNPFGYSGVQTITLSSSNKYLVLKDGVLFDTDGGLVCYPPYRSSGSTYTVPSDTTKIYPQAFEGTASTSTVNVPGNVKEIGEEAFQYCKISTINISSGVVEIGNRAFNNSFYLRTVTIPNSVTCIGSSAFHYCKQLESITVSSGNKYYKSTSGVLFSGDGKTLMVYPVQKNSTSYTVPSTVTKIAEEAFRYNTYLKTITFPSNLTTIGACAFKECTSLTGTITLPNSVTDIGVSAFAKTNITKAIFGTDIKSVSMGIFEDCDSLTQVYFKGNRPFIMFLEYHAKNATYYYPKGDETWDYYASNSRFKTWNTPVIPVMNNPIQNATFKLSATSYTYDGHVKKPGVTVVYNNKTLVEGTDYKLTYSNNINAGTASVRVDGIGRFINSKTINYTIYKAEQTLTAGLAETEIKVGQKTQIKATGIGAISYSNWGYNAEIASVDNNGVVTGKKEGTATIYVTANGNNNYKDSVVSVQVKVVKANTPLTINDLSYSFSNSPSGFHYPNDYRIPLSSYKIMFDDSYAQLLYNHFIEWKGNCYGMSSSTLLFNVPGSSLYLGLFNSSATKVKDLKYNDYSSYLGYNITALNEAMLQIQNDRTVMKIEESHVDDLAGLISEVKKCSSGAPPVMIGMYNNGGHEVLGYKYEKVSSTEDRVHIYDCNYPLKDRYITFTKNSSGSYNNWYYDGGGHYYQYKTHFIDYSDYNTIATSWNNRRSAKNNSSKSTMLTVKNSENFVIKDNKGNRLAEMKNGTLTSTNEYIFEKHGKDEESDGHTIFAPKNLYTIVNNENSGKKLEVLMADDDQNVSVSTESDTVKVFVDDSQAANIANIDGDGGEKFKVELNSGLDYASSAKEVVYEGKNSENELSVGTSYGELVASNYTRTGVKVNSDVIAFTDESDIDISTCTAKLPTTSFNYTGTSIEPKVTVTDKDGNALVEGVDYTVVYAGSCTSGTATAIVYGTNKYTGCTEVNYTINALNLSGYSALLSQTSFIYDETQKKPNVVVKNGSTVLAENIDYSVKYQNNTNVGTAKVIITGINGYKGSITKTFTITSNSVSPTSVSLNRSTLGLGVGESYGLVKTIAPSNANQSVTWSSSNSSVASVSSTGNVTGKKAGTATVTVKTSNGKTASCTVTVKPAPTSVKTNPASLTLGNGESYVISESTNSGSYANAANLKWSSSNTKVVTVTKQGGTNKATLKATGTGTANVTIKLYNGKTATCKVTVKPAPTSLNTNPASVTLGKGESYTISENTNSGSYANAANLSWSSSNTKVATVTKGSGNKATVKAVGTGTANITIKLYNGKTATCKVTVKPAPTSVKLSKTSLTLNKGKTYTISESSNSGSYANAANLKWSSSNTKVATVTKGSGNKATIKAVNKGTAYIKITLYNGKTAQCKVTVK